MPESQLIGLAQAHKVELHGGLTWIDGGLALVEEHLKGPGVGLVLPYVAGWPEVRALVNRLARLQVNEFDGFVLMDGRDTTYVIVPDAPLKLFLTVAPGIAAQRSFEHTVEEIIARDEADRQHKYGALQSVEQLHRSVVVLPTDKHTPESVRDHVYGLMRQVFAGLPEA
jgi:cytidylate kinase